MDRVMVYPGAIPLETDLLSSQKNSMIGLAKLAAAVMGLSTVVNGLACTQTTVPSLAVKVAPGEIYSLANIDGTAYSSLAADTTHSILKQGILLDAVTLACPAPTTAGYSINYLVEAAYLDTDSNALVLPYYNASNPASAYSGPANSGTAQYTTRAGVCNVQVKAGVAAATGTQTTPAVDAGYTALYAVTVAYGATQVLNANISALSSAPFLPSAGLVKGGIQAASMTTAVAAGTADAITAAFSPPVTTLYNGMSLSVRPSAANATTTPTFTPNSGTIGATQIVKGNGSPLVAGDIQGAGHWIDLQWDATLGKWVLLNPAFGASGTAGSLNNAIGVLAASTLTQANFGSFIELGTSTLTQPGYTTIIPAANVQPGAVLEFYNNPFAGSTANPVQTIQVTGCFFFGPGAATNATTGSGATEVSTLSIFVNQYFRLVSDGYNWCVSQGNGIASTATNGYVQLIPTKLVLQWGVALASTGNGDVITLPVAFANAILHINTSDNGINANSTGWQPNGASLNTFKAYGKTVGTGGAYAATNISYLAIGY